MATGGSPRSSSASGDPPANISVSARTGANSIVGRASYLKRLRVSPCLDCRYRAPTGIGLLVIALTSSPTGFPNPHVPERGFRYQLPHDALAELQKSLDAGEQDRFYFFPTKTPGRWRHHLGGCRLAFIEETWAKTKIARTHGRCARRAACREDAAWPLAHPDPNSKRRCAKP